MLSCVKGDEDGGQACVKRVYARIGIFWPVRPSSKKKGGMLMDEKTLERRLCKEIREVGGLALKFVSPGMSGVPDRLVLLPGKKIAFVEVKTPGQRLRPLQVRRKTQLEALGFQVYCLDGIEQIAQIIQGMKKE